MSPGDDIRRVDWRLYARTDRYYIKEYEADSNANFSVLLDVSKSMGFGSGGVTKLEYGKMLAGVPDLSGPPAARPRRPRRLRQRHRRARPAVGEAHGHGAARARPAEADRARQPAGAAAQDGRALRPPRPARPDLGSLRRAGRGARGDRPAALPRQRHHRLPRARQGRAGVHFDDAVGFEDLESGEQIPIVPEALASSTASWSRRTSTRSRSGVRRTASITRC